MCANVEQLKVVSGTATAAGPAAQELAPFNASKDQFYQQPVNHDHFVKN